LDEGNGLAAHAVWSTLVRWPVSATRRVERELRSGTTARLGFDWRIQRVWGVDVALDPFVAAKGRRSFD